MNPSFHILKHEPLSWAHTVLVFIFLYQRIPLHLAADKGNMNILDYLIQYIDGADIDITDMLKVSYLNVTFNCAYLI